MIFKWLKQLGSFIKSAFVELKFINFPTRMDTFKTGSIVITTSVVFATALYLIDWLFQVLRNLLTSINV